MPFDLAWNEPITQQLVWSFIIVLTAIVLTRLLRRVVLLVPDPQKRYKGSKLIGRVVSLLALIVLIGLWSPGAGNVVAIITLIGAGLAIALREVLLSQVAWVIITFRKLFESGDRIEINGVRGDVVDIRILHTTLMEVGGWVDADQSSGRLVHIPNSWVLQYHLLNYSHGFPYVWNEIAVQLTFASDWKAAREAMLRLAGESSDIEMQQIKTSLSRLSAEYLVSYNILTPFVYARIGQDGVILTLRYLCEVRKRRGTEHALTEGILDLFARLPNVEFALSGHHIVQMETARSSTYP
jgi:small-conductance mechanosensitive channel